MGGVRARFGQELRAHWPAIVGFALLIGVLGGVVLAAAAGARRTGTAYDRFLEASHAEDVLIGAPGAGTHEGQQVLHAIRAFPESELVAQSAPMVLFPAQTGKRIADNVAPVGSGVLEDVDRPNVLEGRLPDPERADEVLINPTIRDEYGYEVGDTVDFYASTEGVYYDHVGVSAAVYGERRPLHVVGVGVMAQHIVALGPYDAFPILMMTPAYYAAHPDETFSYSYIWIRLRNGADDLQAFQGHLDETLQRLEIPSQFVPVVLGSDRRAGVNRAIRPQAQALAVFALLLGAVTVFVVGQLLYRHLLADQADRRRLWALGFTRRELFELAMARVVLILAGAVVLATGVAVALSGRMPIGPARQAEPHPGTAVNLTILGVGAVGLVVVFLAVAAVSAYRSLPRLGTSIDGEQTGTAVHRSRVGDALSRAGVRSACVIGVRMAFERGRGSTAVPALGAIVAAALSIGALATAFTFSSNLDRLVESPTLYGWDWDVGIGTGFGGLPLEAVEPALARAGVQAYSGANFGRVELSTTDPGDEPQTVPAVGIDELHGHVYPRLTAGRAAREGEIVLGARVADRLGVGLGDTVLVSHAGTPGAVRSEVVGLAVFPGLGAGIFSTTDLGEGAVVPASLLEDPSAGSLYTFLLADLDPSRDRHTAIAGLVHDFERIDANCVQPGCVVEDLKPPGIKNYDRMRSTPLTLAGVLALLAVLTLAVNLATSVRRRRRDFAVLRSIGYCRRQVAEVCAWQATTVALVALAVGLPVGVVAGRQLWRVFSEAGGSGVDPTTPVLAVALAVPATIVLANLIAFVPGRRAARVQAARVLRSE